MTTPTHDERAQRYAEAIYGTSVIFTDSDPYAEPVCAAMAVADAELDEQAKTRASGHEGELIKATRRADELLVRGDQWKDAALAAEAQVARVVALHVRDDKFGLCTECRQGFPCDTVIALTEADQ